MESANYIDTGQSESTEDKEAVCDESDLITESIETLETCDTMGQKDRGLHSNSDLSEGNLSDGKSELYEIDSKCDGSPKKMKNKNRSESKIKEVEKDGALKGAESNVTSVAMASETIDKSQAKKEKRKRDRKKRKQNKKDRAGSLTEGGEEKENNLQKVDSSETDISEKDEIVKVKEKSESKPKKDCGKKRKNSVAKKSEKRSDLNENNLESGEQIISLTGSKSQEHSSDSEQLRSDSANSGNEETYDVAKGNSDKKTKKDSEIKDEKPQRSSSPSKKKKKKKKLKIVQSLDEADDREDLNLTLEISKSPTSKQSDDKNSLCDSATNGNKTEQKSAEEEIQLHSSEIKADNSEAKTSERKQNSTGASKTEQTSDNSKISEPCEVMELTSDVVSMETKDNVTDAVVKPNSDVDDSVVKEDTDDVIDAVVKEGTDDVIDAVVKENSDVTEDTDDVTDAIVKPNSDVTDTVVKENNDDVTDAVVKPNSDVTDAVVKEDTDDVTNSVVKEDTDDVTEGSTSVTTDIKELLSEIKNVLCEFPVDGCRESSVDPEDHVMSESTNQKAHVTDEEKCQSEKNTSKEISSEEKIFSQNNQSISNPEVKMENESYPQNCSEKGSESKEDVNEVTGCSKDSDKEDVLVENRSESLETQSEMTCETLVENTGAPTEQPTCQQSKPDTHDTLCKNNIPNHSATDNSNTWNEQVKDILSNMVDNVLENFKSDNVPKDGESVVPDHVDLSDIEDVSVDSIGSEDLPQSKKSDSEIHVPLNPSKLRDELVKLENENLSVIADLEKDADLLEGNESTAQQADVSASHSKEDNSQRDLSSHEADAGDVVDSTNCSDDPGESSVDCVDGLDVAVLESNKAKEITKPVISVRDVGVETEADEEKIQMREEIERLKEELNSTKDALQKSQSQVYRHQIHSNLTVSTLQAQLHKKDMEMKQAQINHDQQIEAVISRLFLLEGEIRREQKQILGLLDLKETVIDKQGQKIEELINTNDKLSMALKLHNIGTNGLVTPLNRSTGDLSPANKTSYKDKESPKNMKLRWGTMKDKLRRHKSSFELHHPDRMETLEEGTFRYGSQENLSNSKRVKDRKERCRSYAEYPQSLRDSPLVELPNENDYQKSDCSETTSLNMAEGEINDGQSSPSSSSDDNSINSDMSGLVMRRGSITSLPNGVGLISSNRGSSPNIYKDVRELSPHEKPVKQTSPSTHHHGESNPFKSIKTMLKRRGSKLRSKKRNAADPQLNESEQKEAMKNHFKKYEMH